MKTRLYRKVLQLANAQMSVTKFDEQTQRRIDTAVWNIKSSIYSQRYVEYWNQCQKENLVPGDRNSQEFQSYLSKTYARRDIEYVALIAYTVWSLVDRKGKRVFPLKTQVCETFKIYRRKHWSDEAILLRAIEGKTSDFKDKVRIFFSNLQSKYDIIKRKKLRF